MPALCITANSAAEAIAQIHQQLGPDAVILNVRPAPVTGIGALWRKRQIEVTAQAPVRSAAPAVNVESVLEKIRHLNRQLPPARPARDLEMPLAIAPGAALELRPYWRPAPPIDQSRPQGHVFVGPPGSGKTTLLCKWLAQVVLLDNRSAQVWRLDAKSANTAEALTIYGEILGVPVERSWSEEATLMAADFSFIDMPGCDWMDESSIEELSERLPTFEPAHVHLVLNAAYHVPLLIEQVRAAARLRISDLIFTHLDEVRSWSLLSDIIRHCSVPIRFLSEGQNVPGKLIPATLEHFLPRAVRAEFPRPSASATSR